MTIVLVCPVCREALRELDVGTWRCAYCGYVLIVRTAGPEVR